MNNRLKCVRIAQNKTQQEVASFVGISQNAYSYWESGKTKIHNESIIKLSEYFNVSTDFLLGKRYKMERPPQTWHHSLQDEYSRATPLIRQYMEYKYGDIVYINDEDEVTECAPTENMVIYHRDGKTVTKKFSKKQMRMIAQMLDAIPEDED